MARCILRFVPGFWAWLATAAVYAQPGAPPKGPPPFDPAPPIGSYAIALLFTILLLTIVCMPTRKR